jgi:hypothetical protein
MKVFKKELEPVEKIQSNCGKSIGLSRESIIKNLKKDDIYIIDGLFFYTSNQKFNEISFYFLLGDKVVSEIIYNVIEERIISETFTSEISKILKNVFYKNIQELKNLKNKVIC